MTSGPRRPRVLYIASGGIREPLIESQVLAYLRKLRAGLDGCHLITMERHPIGRKQREQIRSELITAGIEWTAIERSKWVGPINPLRTIAMGITTAKTLHAREQFDFVHARSFFPGVIARQLKRRLGTPFIYDMRGLWVLEKEAKGTLRSKWLRNQLWKVERSLYRNADEVISLTDAARDWLQERTICLGATVIPCCVDIDRFKLKPFAATKPLRMISVGSLGPGYSPEAVFRVFKAGQRIDPNCELDLVSRSDLSSVQQAAENVGVEWTNRISFRSLPSRDVPDAIHEADIGLCMVEPSEAKIASSPTKLAEYHAAGKPVIACEGCGDVEKILEADNLGATVHHDRGDRDFSAVQQCIKLLKEPGFAERCRAVAESQFSLEVGVRRYSEVYSRLTHRVS